MHDIRLGTPFPVFPAEPRSLGFKKSRVGDRICP